MNWWPKWRTTFLCACGTAGEFTPDTYVIREQQHNEDCEFQYQVQPKEHCSCPVTDARYVKICPNCRRGHWKEAT